MVAGASAIDLKRGLDQGVRAAVEALRTLSRPVKTRLEKAQVATLSAHNDPTIGELIAEAMEKVPGQAGRRRRRDPGGRALRVDGGGVVNEMRRSPGMRGFDAARKDYVDLVEAGIVDPTKVVRIALENAVSAASLLLLTEATLTEAPEPKDEHGGHPPAYE